MNLKINLSNLPYHIVCLVILMNIIQLGLGGIGVGFNMFYIEYLLIILLFFIKDFKIKNYYNIILLLIITISFLFSLAFNYNDTIYIYIKEFIICSLPLILIFLFDYDYKKLFTLFAKYCFFTLILYQINLLLNTNLLTNYMDFGYGGIFTVTYLTIYSIMSKNKKLLTFALLSSLLIFAYGSRGAILVLILGLLLTGIFNINSNRKKILLIIIGAIFLIFNYQIIEFGVNLLTNIFGNDLYAIKQLNNMINNDSIDKVLGGRYYIYKTGIEEIKANYLLGMGIAAFQDKYGYFVHNIFLDVYSTFGTIIGTLYFIFLIFLTKKTYLLAKKDTNIKTFFIFCLTIPSKLLISKTFIYDPYIWILISIFLNIICTKKELNKSPI